MNRSLEILIDQAKTNDPKIVSDALTDLGLLVERHTQNRYSEDDYLSLLGNNEELFNLKLTDKEVELLVCFFFYHILNIHVHPVTVVWCLGKCYNLNILDGMNRLINVFQSNDEIVLQLLYSVNALFGLENIMPTLLILREKKELHNTQKYLEELSSDGFFGSVLN